MDVYLKGCHYKPGVIINKYLNYDVTFTLGLCEELYYKGERRLLGSLSFLWIGLEKARNSLYY